MAKYRDTVETLLTARNEVAGELRQAEAQMRQQAAKQKQQAAEQERLLQQRVDVEREIRDRQLRMQGRHMEADLQQVRSQYGRRITAARQANQQELADRLEHLRNLREQEIRQSHESRRRTQQARQRGLIGRLGGVQGAMDVLAGGAGIGVAMQMGRGLERLGESAGELVEKLERGEVSMRGFMREVAEATPIIGQGMRIGDAWADALARGADQFPPLTRAIETIFPLFKLWNRTVGEGRREFAEFQREVEAMEDFRDQFEQRMGLEDQADEARHQQQLMRADEPEQRRLELRRQRDRELREIEEQRIKAEARGQQETVEAAREAEQEIRALYQHRFAALETEQQEAARAEARQRTEAARDAADQVRQLWLQQTGQTQRAEIEAIRRTTAERVRAAEEARNLELAEHERMLGRMREMEMHLKEQRREDVRELEAERERAADRVARMQDRISGASGRGGPAALPSLDQNRFLTGVRQATQQQDRAVAERERQQVRLLEQQLAEFRAARRAIEENTRQLEDAPLVRVANLRGGP